MPKINKPETNTSNDSTDRGKIVSIVLLVWSSEYIKSGLVSSETISKWQHAYYSVI